MFGDRVKKNEFGYYELVHKPGVDELSDYYSAKYYQESLKGYDKAYSESEIAYIHNKIEQKYEVIQQLSVSNPKKNTLLDIGAGEGWALQSFHQKSWKVTGLDYSDYGCKTHNPSQLANLLVGDYNDHIGNLILQEEKFDVIWLDNVLEHVLDPLELLLNCRKLINQDGILVIEVPNDFSKVQMQLYEQGKIETPFWIAIPDHISYFNREGLRALCQAAGFDENDVMSDYPIDFHLFIDETNYTRREIGKACHQARMDIDHLLHSISVEKTNGFYRALADLGLGRQIIGFYKGE